MPVPLIAVAGYGTAVLVSAAIAALHAGRVVVPRVAEWEEPPDVWLHPDLHPLFGPLGQAVAAWEALGHELGTTRLGGVGGHIRIEPMPLGRTRALALAAVSADFEDDPEASPHEAPEVDAPDGVIRRAVVYVEPDADARTLAHELGHCLGYLHCTARLGRRHAANRDVVVQVPKSGHLMHPRWEEGGWGTTGLEAATLGTAHERRLARRRERERRQDARREGR
jgi:hypothetical protein